MTLLTVTQNQSAVRPISCHHYWIWKTCGWQWSIYWLFFPRHMSTLHLFVRCSNKHSYVNRDNIFFSCSLVAELKFFMLNNTMNKIYIKKPITLINIRAVKLPWSWYFMFFTKDKACEIYHSTYIVLFKFYYKNKSDRKSIDKNLQ